MLTDLIIIALALAASLLAAVVYGAFRWNAGTRELRVRLEAARAPSQPRVVDFRELDGLPAPVQRYFRTVLRDGQPIIGAASIEHAGTFNMGESAARWKPFTSTQRVITRRPGFDWDARVALFPGVAVHVHDAYVAGEGLLQAKLLGLVTVMSMPGTPELARGELMRFCAEAAWYPTVLLPSQGISWEAADDSSAKATLTDGATTITLLFRFNEGGLIAAVHADERGYAVNGTIVPMPWEGRFRNYVLRNDMRVPMEGEVAWLLPQGRKPYWRGRITRLSYEFGG
jgi:hypothetical protein